MDSQNEVHTVSSAPSQISRRTVLTALAALLFAPEVHGQEFGPPEPPSPRALKKVEYLTPLPAQPIHPIVERVLKDADRHLDWIPAVKTRFKELTLDLDAESGETRESAQEECRLLLGSVIGSLENPIPNDVLSVLDDAKDSFEQKTRADDVRLFVRLCEQQEPKRLSLKPMTSSDFESEYERRTGRKIAVPSASIRQRLMREKIQPERGKNTAAEFLLDLCNRTSTSLDYDRKTDTIVFKDGVAPAIPLGDFVLMKIRSNDGVVLFSLTGEICIGFGEKNLETKTDAISLLVPSTDKIHWGPIGHPLEKPKDILHIPPNPPFTSYELDSIVAGSMQEREIDPRRGLDRIGFQRYWVQVDAAENGGYDISIHITFDPPGMNGCNLPEDGTAYSAAETNRYELMGKNGPIPFEYMPVEVDSRTLHVNIHSAEAPKTVRIKAPTSLHQRQVQMDMKKLRALIPPPTPALEEPEQPLLEP